VENLGLRLFTERSPRGAGCAGCHEIPTFALDANEGSNGLDAGQTVVFKSPSLKNVAITGPYMHDGRFATLLEVVEHYNSGVQGGPALDRRLRGRGGQPGRLNLTEVEKNAMVAFLGTLTDFDLLADPRFSDPFIH
jgi:cytochrome c peroxidase